MSFDYREFKKFVEQVEKLSKTIDKEIEDFLYEIALKALARTKKRTPVDTGDLRNQWSLSKITRVGNSLSITLYNPLEYASYVEYGHRVVKQFVSGEWKGNQFIYNPDANTGVVMGTETQWIEGQFMATISMKEINNIIPAEWNKRLKKLLGDIK